MRGGINIVLKNPNATNGVNGSAGPALKSPPTLSRRTSPQMRQRPRRSLFARVLNILARVFTWLSIYTVLFRCPDTLEACDSTSPRICKPYFRVRHAAAPYVEPYYETYAAPYVEKARPYYYTLDHNVITPGKGYATQYGAPLVAQAQAQAQAAWEKRVQPQLVEYQNTLKVQYDRAIAPRVTSYQTALSPYYDAARENALQSFHGFILPTYEVLQPYARRGYYSASSFVANTAIPNAVWAWNRLYVFLDGTVWPQVKLVYAENVEPQLVKIGERLGRYNRRSTMAKPSAAQVTSLTSTATSTFAKPSPSTSSMHTPNTTASLASSGHSKAQATLHSRIAEDATSLDSASAATAVHVRSPELGDEGGGEAHRIAREAVAADLEGWRRRFDKAVKEGAAEMWRRVDETSHNMIQENAKTTGMALIRELQTTAESVLSALRDDLEKTTDKVSAADCDSEQVQEMVAAAVRRAGIQIKEKAQEVRVWRKEYAAELRTSVTGIAENYVEILDSIRDLAIQKIGMKWAWTDGITYQDWVEYHTLKNKFEELWHDDLERSVVTRPSLLDAQIEASRIEGQAMDIAQSAAQELGRLKQLAIEKVTASHASDESDSHLTEQARALEETAEEASVAHATGTVDGGTVAPCSESAEPVVSAEGILVPSAASVITAPVEGATSLASALIGRASNSSTSLAGRPTNEPRHMAKDATSPILESPPTSISEVAGSADKNGDSGSQERSPLSAPDLASKHSASIIAETPVFVGNNNELGDSWPAQVEAPAEEPTDLEEGHASPLATTTSLKPAIFGAAAQAVPERVPILEGDALDNAASVIGSVLTDLPASVTSAAQSAYSAAVSHANEQYSEVLSAALVQISGTPAPAHEQMLASITSAYSNALASASSRVDGVVRALQGQPSPTPTTNDLIPTVVPVPALPTVDWARVESIATERLNEGRAWAEQQYESAKSMLGLATPTPSTPAEHADKILERARYHYYAGLGVAHERYSEFLGAASAALGPTTAAPRPTGLVDSMSSVASVAGGSAALASEAVASSWDETLSKISAGIYGAPVPTPWYESVYSVAGDHASSASSAAGSSAASVTCAAGVYSASASEEAARQYSAVSSIMSELVLGREPNFTQSVYSRLEAVYTGGLATATSAVSVAQASASSVASDASEAVASAGEKVASVVKEKTEAIKETTPHRKDEL